MGEGTGTVTLLSLLLQRLFGVDKPSCQINHTPDSAELIGNEERGWTTENKAESEQGEDDECLVCENGKEAAVDFSLTLQEWNRREPN